MIHFNGCTDNILTCPFCLTSNKHYISNYPSSEELFNELFILWCPDCGSGYTPLDKNILNNYYEQSYAVTNRKDRFLEPSEYFASIEKGNMAGYVNRAFLHLRILTKYHGKFDKVLDYGSGPGYFLYLSEAKEKYAIDLDQYSVKYLRHIGATVLTLNECPEQYFDIIEASHSFEHLHFEELHKNVYTLVSALKKNGIMLIEVPNGGFSYLESPEIVHAPHTLFFSPQGILSFLSRFDITIKHYSGRAYKSFAFRKDPIYTCGDVLDFFHCREAGFFVLVQKN